MEANYEAKRIVIKLIIIFLIFFPIGYFIGRIMSPNYITFEHHSVPIVACDANGNPVLVTAS